jgi:glycosyltransferase involved in cell wall biosynthesis
MTRHRALYAAFDRVPSAKGASIHIAHTVRALAEAAGDALLVCVDDGELPSHEVDGTLEVRRFGAGAADFVERVRAYQGGLAATLEEQRASLAVCHFRDPWSGIPVLEARGGWRSVYEVNGLPSIEMPARYPRLGAATLARIRAMEERCLAGADLVLTPSATIAAHLAARGVAPARLTVIPNGAEIPASAPRPGGAPERYVLYFGALQPWQGVRFALRALSHLADTALSLVICSSHPPAIGAALKGVAERLRIGERVQWMHELSREALAPWVQHAVASLAPLTDTPRNVEQGCCPLKVLESMAAGTPVVASDLAPVRELMAHRQHGLLVRPGRPEALARAVRELDDYPRLRDEMGDRARERVRAHYAWEEIERRTRSWYREAVLA